MSIPRYLLSSSMISGAVFCAATIPMATLDSQPIEVMSDGEPVFVGQLRELAAPYLGLATAASLGMGVMTLSVLGWSQSSSKISRSEDEIAQLRKDLRDRDSMIEQLKFSDARLEAAGLGAFIEDDDLQSSSSMRRQLPQHQVSPVGSASVQATPHGMNYQVVHSIGNGDRPDVQPRQRVAHSHANPHQAQRMTSSAIASTASQQGNGQRRAQSTAAHRSAPQPPAPPMRQGQHAKASGAPARIRTNSSVRSAGGQSVPTPANQQPGAQSPELNDLLNQIQHIMVKVEEIKQGSAAA